MQSNRNDNLYKYSTQTPWRFIIVTLLYAIGAVSIPANLFTFMLGDTPCGLMISTLISRLIGCVLPIWLFFELRLQKILTFKGFLKGLLPLLPFLLVAINNFPIFSLLQGECTAVAIKQFTKWICYALACFGGVFLEELCFRGLIFTALLRKYKDNKFGLFYSILFSSLIFGSVHIVNLLGGASPGAVVMQMGYSFLIGGMCAISFAKSGNFYHAVLMHFVFNFGGLLAQYSMVSGNVWSILQIVATAVLAVVVIVYALYLVFKNKKFTLQEKINLGEL